MSTHKTHISCGLIHVFMQVSTKYLSAVDITTTEDIGMNRAGTISHTASGSLHPEAYGTHVAEGS